MPWQDAPVLESWQDAPLVDDWQSAPLVEEEPRQVEAQTSPVDEQPYESDLLRRIPAGIADAALGAASGLLEAGKYVDKAVQTVAPFAHRFFTGGKTPDPAAQNFLREAQANVAETYGVDPRGNQRLPAQIIQGAGSIVPVIASGPAAPLTVAGMMGESQLAEAKAAGATEEQQTKAFLGGAGLGAASEALLGVPAILRSAKAGSGVLAQAGKSAVRESVQEGVQQAGSNVVASDVAAYDPERPLQQGVGTSMLVGGIVGGPVGAVIQAAANADAAIAEMKAAVPDTTGIAPKAVESLSPAIGGVEQSAATNAAPATVVSTESLPEMPRTSVAPASESPVELSSGQSEPAQATGQQPISAAVETSMPALGEVGVAGSPAAAETSTPSLPATPVVESAPAGTVDTGENVERGGVETISSLEQQINRLLQKRSVAETPEERTALFEQAMALQSRQDELERNPQGFPFGPGKMTAGELPPQGTTSLKRAVVDTQRTLDGREAIEVPSRPAIAEQLSSAEDRIGRDQSIGLSVVERILDRGVEQQTVSTDDAAVMLVERTRLRNERQMAEDRMADPTASDSEKAVALAQFNELENQIDRIDHASRIAGTAWSDFGRLYQQVMREDYTLEAMERRVRAKKGDALTPEETATIKAEHERLQVQMAAYEARVKELEANQARLEAEAALKSEVKSTRIDQRVIDYADKIVQGWESEADAARKRLRSRLGMAASGIDPSILGDLVVVARALIGRKAVDFSTFTADAIESFGEGIQPYLQPAWDAANKGIDKLLRTKPRAKKAIKAKQAATQERPSIIESLKAAQQEGEQLGAELDRYVKELVRNHVLAGERGLDAVMEAVRAELEPIIPGITVRQVMDAYSDYGKSTAAPTDPAKITLAELRSEAQKTSALQDILEKKEAPKATGKQRVAQSDLSRRLTKQINEAKRRFNIQPTDPTSALKSALESRKTYYRHRLADLRYEIAQKQRIVRTSTAAPTDAELESLRAEYATVKAEHDTIFTKPGLSDEQRVKLAVAAAERAEGAALAALDRAKRGDFTSTAKPSRTPKSAQVDAIKARILATREQIKELRNADAAVQTEKAARRLEAEKKVLQKAIAAAEAKIKAGDTSTAPTRQNRPLTPELEVERQKLDALNRQLAEMRKKTPEQKEATAHVARVRALERQLAERSAKLAAGDTSAAPRQVNRPLRPDLEVLRQQIDAVNKQLADLRKGPAKSKEEIALQSYKARLATQLADLAERQARALAGDATVFAKRERKPLDISKDSAAMKLKADVEKSKNDFNRMAQEYALRNRTWSKKAWDAIRQTRRVAVNIVSSIDFSAMRQAVFAMGANATRLSKPGMVLRPFRDMFKGWASEDFARQIEQQLQNRPNAKAGLDKTAGIEFTPLDETVSFTRQEENARSLLDDLAVLPFSTGNLPRSIVTAAPKALAKAVRMSNRAFISFLNRTRADLFDELLRANFSDRPPTKLELEAIGNMVNVATGRGKLKPTTASVASEILWSPKLLASRIQLLSLHPLKGGSLRTKKIIAKEYARFAISAYVLGNVIALFSDKEDEDSRSSDWAKIVRNNTRIDLWGGLQQVAVFAERLRTGQTKTIKGELLNIRNRQDVPILNQPVSGDTTTKDGKRAYNQSMGKVLGSFILTKLRPDLGAAWALATEEDFKGQPVDLTDTAESVFVPLALRDVFAIFREHDIPEATALLLLAQFGAGVAVYEDAEVERQK